jgi:hypothetical protein
MKARILLVITLLALVRPAFGAARITIVNVNLPGVGFNDATPATPVGGNTGTTVGEQRLIAFQFAADLWGAALDSRVEIRVQASFLPLFCTSTTAVLGQAGALSVFSDFAEPHAAFAETWYPAALANKITGEDLDAAAEGDDIIARFNENLGLPECLATSGWYYGLDTNTPSNRINLVTVLLHEFAHGLGFQSFASSSTGAYLLGISDVFSKFYFDNSTGKARDAMVTDAERAASAINPRNVVWTGNRVTADVPAVLSLGTPLLNISAPATVEGNYPVGAAAFGPPLTEAGVYGLIVVATDAADAAGPSTTDGCSAIVNPAVAGQIALVDRGTCGFVAKVKNAQNAGAVAVIVADNAAGGPPAGLGGVDPTITIPSVRITLDAGNAIRAALTTGPVSAALLVDPTIRAGADPEGRALLFTPNPVQPGSSVSHWDTSASPNQLMEPNINADLPLAVDVPYDLTLPLMRDIGWYLDRDLDLVPDEKLDRCLGSNMTDTVIIGKIDTRVPNTVVPNGCTVSDYIAACSVHAKRHGGVLSCVAKITMKLEQGRFITREDRKTILRAVARSKYHRSHDTDKHSKHDRDDRGDEDDEDRAGDDNRRGPIGWKP